MSKCGGREAIDLGTDLRPARFAAAVFAAFKDTVRPASYALLSSETMSAQTLSSSSA